MPRRNHKIRIRAQYANRTREQDRAKRRERLAARTRDKARVSR